MTKFQDFSARLVDGREQPMSAYAGKVVLALNVASQCGFTPQYAGLETLYRKYRDDGLVVLGFPCNQFGMQEPGTELEIASFCQVNYDVTFPIFSKIVVNGRGAHPIFQWLKRKAPGLLGVQTISWNFTKFLVDRSGTRVKRFASAVEPAEMVGPIEAMLAEQAGV
jgi:glutathione peroxidase